MFVPELEVGELTVATDVFPEVHVIVELSLDVADNVAVSPILIDKDVALKITDLGDEFSYTGSVAGVA